MDAGGFSWSSGSAARSIPNMTSEQLGKSFTMQMSSRASAAEAVGWAGIESVSAANGPFVDESEVVPRIRVGGIEDPEAGGSSCEGSV
ncbi:Uncharacterised protein [Mycobacteroides abscessus subsp. abscessus]|nr:Uncharacterised protein [Mycobacteroides abscessus subsp. abscessus]SIC78890.1 Uncharacterised protein [Mycobacteroides abscessus subsp. abscessus]SKK33187.1 Uncharacterised protein [Mycobacteroides abscessus subsp. abscessus]SKP26955.1 Uncharacterised protein [Mycobacteroides abscessus subsp. abscessus]